MENVSVLGEDVIVQVTNSTKQITLVIFVTMLCDKFNKEFVKLKCSLSRFWKFKNKPGIRLFE